MSRRRAPSYNNLTLEQEPPGELKALCGLSDVQIEYVYGRPGKAWRLFVAGRHKTITLQTTEMDAWVDACRKLLE